VAYFILFTNFLKIISTAFALESNFKKENNLIPFRKLVFVEIL